MDSQFVDRIKLSRFILHIRYPEFNSYIFFIYLFIKYTYESKRCLKYSDKNFHKIGLNARMLPRKLLKRLRKQSGNTFPYDIQHQIIVPQRLFYELYAENVYFRDGLSLWITMKVSIKEIDCPWISKGRTYISNIKKIIGKDLQFKSSMEQLTTKLGNMEYNENIDKNVVIERIVQIIPNEFIHENVAYIDETSYFSLTKRFITRHLFENNVFLRFHPIKHKIMAPHLADKIVLELINSPIHIGTDLIFVMLEKYFSTPKFLHENDYFAIPLTEKYMKQLYFKYFTVVNEIEQIYFRCKKITSKKVGEFETRNRLKINTVIGYFAVKGHTEIVQEQNITSFIPLKKHICLNLKTDLQIIKHIEHACINSCPYGLEKYLRDFEKAIKPFLLDKEVNPLNLNLKCVLQPVFLLRGEMGSGRSILISLLASCNGMNYFSTSCRHITASTSKQTEAKLDAILQRAKNSAPVIVYLEDFEVFAIDPENNEDSRIVESFSQKLRVLFENFTKQPIIIFAGCDSNVELKSNLGRVFLEEFTIKTLNKEERLQILKWMILAKNITLCDDNFQPIISSIVKNNVCKMKIFDDDLNYNLEISNHNEENANLKHYITDDTIKNNSIIMETDNILNITLKDIDKWTFDQKTSAILEKVVSKTEAFLFNDLDSLIYLVLRDSYLAQKKYRKDFTKSADEKILSKMGYVREIDFENALEKLRAMHSKKLTPLKVPNVKWEDVGGLDDLKKEIFRTIELPLKFPHLLAGSGLKRSGILLWGPPGCGKTLVARAVASQLQATFLSVKGPELLDMYVGQSEKNMRDIFAAARSSAPCVIFFDEAEAAAGARGAAGDAGGAADRLVSQLLAELDGVAARQVDMQTGAVVVIAATNRPDLVEPALLRPGRLDKLLYVGPYKGMSSKIRVLKASCRGFNLDESVTLNDVADTLPERCTGADLASVAKKARHQALTRLVQNAELGEINSNNLTEKDVVLQQSDFYDALGDFVPSISEAEMNYYESLKNKLS